jgi:D-alanyl-D-alanine carboxypeptidase/D-alanyl-D-alanine-endopeptidase (penicillin-binding protein 4)
MTKHANVGLSVRSVNDNQLLSHYNHEYSLIPASSLKLITTLIALEKIGGETRYETYLAYDGQIDPDGTLQGNLYIIGAGDPTLGSSRIPGTSPRNDLLIEIAEMVKKKGITCIDGKVVADESIFDAYPIAPSWQWNDLGNYYAGGAWGLNINENEYGIYFNSNRREGSLSKLLFTDFKIPGLKLINEVTVDSANTGDNAYVFGGPYDFEKRIAGTIPKSKNKFKIKGAIPDPPKYIAYAIREKLAKQGIRSNGTHVKVKKWSKNYKHTTIFDTIISPPISEIVKYANYFSVNQYCESLLKSLGLKVNGKGSGGQGIRAIFKSLKEYKIDSEGLHMEDGSGLSARNLISPDILAEFLAKYTDKNGLKVVQKMLPKAGADGTVRRLLSGRKSRGSVWVKSGSMERILSYTGLCKAKSGEWVTFSIIINGYTGKYRNFRPQVESLIDQIYKQH